MVEKSAREDGSSAEDALVRQLSDLCRFAMTAKADHQVISISELERREREWPMKRLLSLRRQIEDPYTGVVYAAHSLGQALASVGGFALLHTIVDRIEEEVGQREAVWLRRRWVGISSPAGEVWS